MKSNHSRNPKFITQKSVLVVHTISYAFSPLPSLLIQCQISSTERQSGSLLRAIMVHVQFYSYGGSL
jgi:hypothetical protein